MNDHADSIEVVLDENALELLQGAPRDAIGWQAQKKLLQDKIGDADFLSVDGTCASVLKAIHGYKRTGPEPHWLLATFGFGELFGKETDNSEVSGWGYELTLRIAGDGDSPPEEALTLLNSIAEYVFDYGAALSAGHTLDLSDSLDDELPEVYWYVSLRSDPELESGETPHGKLDYVQVVLTTKAEQNAMVEWKPSGVMDLLSAENSLLIAKPDRPCMLDQPEIRKAIEKSIETEGSSGELLVMMDRMKWKDPSLFRRTATLVIASDAVAPFCKRLRGRIPFGRPLTLLSEVDQVVIEPAEHSELFVDGEFPVLHLTKQACQELVSELQSGAIDVKCPGVPVLSVMVSI